MSFKKVSLANVLKTVNKHYKKELHISKSAYLEKELTVTFDNQKLEEVIEILELIIGEENIITQ